MCQMKNILHIFLISCFSLTIISCAKSDHEHDSTANTIVDTTTINYVVGTASGFVLTSADGTNWTLRETTATNPIIDVIYANSKFVAVGGYGIIRTSSDGTSWKSSTSGTSNHLYGVAYGNSKFVAVGHDGVIRTSSGWTFWGNSTSGTSTDLYDVTYGNSKFVAVGQYGTTVTSSDGITWTATSNILNQSDFNSITSK